MCNKTVYSPDIFLEVLNEATKIQSGWQTTWHEFQHRIPRNRDVCSETKSLFFLLCSCWVAL